MVVKSNKPTCRGSTRGRTRIYRRKWPPRFPKSLIRLYHLGHARTGEREKTRLSCATQYDIIQVYSFARIIEKSMILDEYR